MALNVVLDHCTFEKTLMQHDLSSRSENKVVPVVSRAYEESFMRECVASHDVPCSLGQYCECTFIDEEHRFVGVYFVLPELRSEETSMCILCQRKLTQVLFYRLASGGHASEHCCKFTKTPATSRASTTRARCSSCPRTGPCRTCRSVVSHQRHKYHVVHIDGHRHLRQRNVYVEDFR